MHADTHTMRVLRWDWAFVYRGGHIRENCEEPSGDVAISWYHVQIRTHYQEIATPSARNDSIHLQLVLLVGPCSHRTWSAGS